MKILKKIGFIGLLLIGLLTAACSEDETHGFADKGSIKVSKERLTLAVGEKIKLSLSFNSRQTEEKEIVWESDNPQIASVVGNADRSATVTGLGVGKVKIRAVSSDQELQSECEVEVSNEKLIRILAIGNSFSEDAVENYLYDLAKAAGIQLVIGNLYVGGCSLEQHVENALNNQSAYEYRKVNSAGVFSNENGWSISRALADENWDYISFQEVSQQSGIYSYFEESLPTLVDYVKGQSTNPDTRYILHQTWAYAKSSTHSGFPNYDKDQMKMYEAIVDAVWKAAELIGADMVVPAGTAIQNGRTSIIGDNFCKDGYHLEINYGRFTAACTWFEQLLGIDVTTNTYKPSTVSDYDAEIAKHAAHLAVAKPKEVTEMVDYQQEAPNTIVLTNAVYLDFGRVQSGYPFNNMIDAASGRKTNLIDKEGKDTGITIEISSRFESDNDLGEENTTTGLPTEVTKDAFWSSGTNYPSGSFTVSRLNKSQKYDFSFYGSRKDASDNRETAYAVKGKNEGVAYLNASSNKSQIATVSGIEPDSDGKIEITVSAGPNNNNGAKYYYINAMGIIPATP